MGDVRESSETTLAGLSGGVMITRWWVAKSARSLTPGSAATVSIADPLADANTSAVASLEIWFARSVEDPKLNTTLTPGWIRSKSMPSCVNAAVSDEAANTVRSVVCCCGVSFDDEHPTSTSDPTNRSERHLIGRAPRP